MTTASTNAFILKIIYQFNLSLIYTRSHLEHS